MDIKVKSTTHLICLIFFILGARYAFAENSLENYCQKTYHDTQECPAELCNIGCANGEIVEGCDVVCHAKECTQISTKSCPLDMGCQLLLGCDQAETCYYKPTEFEEPECGELSYSGNKNCCDGFIKRCGIDFFNGTCDMIGLDEKYRLPICIPCGDGVCGQFENHCNCPEDCGPDN